MPILDIEIVSDRQERILGHITDAVARITRRPRESVHVEFMPPARGRIAFGGQLVE